MLHLRRAAGIAVGRTAPRVSGRVAVARRFASHAPAVPSQLDAVALKNKLFGSGYKAELTKNWTEEEKAQVVELSQAYAKQQITLTQEQEEAYYNRLAAEIKDRDELAMLTDEALDRRVLKDTGLSLLPFLERHPKRANMVATLEWALTSPPDLHLFDEPPLVYEVDKAIFDQQLKSEIPWASGQVVQQPVPDVVKPSIKPKTHRAPALSQQDLLARLQEAEAAIKNHMAPPVYPGSTIISNPQKLPLEQLAAQEAAKQAAEYNAFVASLTPQEKAEHETYLNTEYAAELKKAVFGQLVAQGVAALGKGPQPADDDVNDLAAMVAKAGAISDLVSAESAVALGNGKAIGGALGVAVNQPRFVPTYNAPSL